MKKILIMMSILAMTVTVANASETNKAQNQDVVQQRVTEKRMQRDNMFEKRLELTEVQKLKARQIRQSGHEKLIPLFEQVKSKKQEAEMIRRSRMAVQMQEEKLTVIDKELKVLEKQIHDIKRANMKEFESILTRQQKRTLKQMKQEGRKKYQMEHPNNIQKMMHQQNFGMRKSN